MENKPKHIDSYEINARVSNLIWDPKTRDRIYITDWNGSLHILRGHKFGPKMEILKQEKLLDSIFSIDEFRNSPDGTTTKLILGGGNGELISYDIESEKKENIGLDKEGRPISKVISVKDKNLVFTFSWNKALQVWDLRQKNSYYVHKLKENFVTAEYVHPYIVPIFGNNSIAFINTDIYSKGSTLREKSIGTQDMVRSISLTQDLKYFAFGDTTGNVKVFKRNSDLCDLSSSVAKSLLDRDFTSEFECTAHFKKANQQPTMFFPTNAVDFDPTNSNILYSAGSDGSVCKIDMERVTGTKKGSHSSNIRDLNAISHLKCNKDGSLLLTAQLIDNYSEIITGKAQEYKSKSVIKIFSTTQDDDY